MLTRALALCSLLVFVLSATVYAAPKTGFTSFIVGNAADAQPSASLSPGLVLMGGGTDVDAAFQWMCQRAGGGDFVVIRTTGTDAYNPYIQQLCPQMDSVETIIITSVTGANSAYVSSHIQNAEALWIAGGDQSTYVNLWRGTAVQTGVNFLLNSKLAPVGGTIAGSCFGLALSYLVHPYRPRLSLAAMRELLGYSKWLQLANILAFASARAADFIIARITGAAALGFFTIAKEISRLPSTELAAPIHRGVFPGYAKVAADPILLKSAYLKVVSVIVLVVFPAGIGLSLVADPVVHKQRAVQAASVTTMSMGAPPELIEAACAKASLPLSEAAQAFKASTVGKLTSDIR